MGFFIFCYARKKLCEVLETNVPSALKTIQKSAKSLGKPFEGEKEKNAWFRERLSPVETFSNLS